MNPERTAKLYLMGRLLKEPSTPLRASELFMAACRVAVSQGQELTPAFMAEAWTRVLEKMNV